MKDLVEISNLFHDVNKSIIRFQNFFDIQKIKNRIAELKNIQDSSSFWNNQKKAIEIINELNDKENTLNLFNSVNNNFKDLQDLLKILSNQKDNEMLKLANEIYLNLNNDINKLKIKLLLNAKYDNLNAIIDIHSGAGGVDSMDWANMLFRMYVKFSEKHNLKIQLINCQYGEEAGIKCATMKVIGLYAYGFFKSEKGIHRLIRISPFDANSRRHTSFASVNVIPEFDDNIDIVINDNDLKIDTFRSSGAGGQNVNKVSSAVRITHIPTGVVVSCQVERSQIMNKKICMKMLKNILYQKEIQKKQEKIDQIVGEQKDIEWGNQIRSYVFCPYTLVKDHRTNYESTKVNDVMNGDLDDFIFSFLEKESKIFNNKK